MDNHDQALEARARALLKSECPECGGAGYTEDDDGLVRCQTCLNDYDVNKAQAIRAIVAALREARVPEGFVLVPAQLTDDMAVAFCEEWFSKVRPIDDPEMEDAYAAMLAAAKDGRP